MNMPFERSIKSIAVDSSGDIFSITDTIGVLRTIDSGKTWSVITSGLPADTTVAMALGASNNMFLVFKNMGVYKSKNNGDEWSSINSGIENETIQCIAINELNWIYIGTNNNGIFHSTNSGVSWEHDSTDVHNINVIACQPGGLVFANYNYSTDYGKTWTDGPTMLATPICIGVKGVHWYNGVVHGIYSSHSQGQGSWGHTPSPLSGFPVFSVLPLFDGGTALAGSGNGLYYSNDLASTWVNVSGQLPELNINSMAIDSNGFVYLGTSKGIYVTAKSTSGGITGVGNRLTKNIPSNYFLRQNYPNPFNPTTTIVIDLPERSNVQLEIFDILGRKVETIVNSVLAQGIHSYQWNAKYMDSGVYFCHLITNKTSQAIKLILSK
jgi:hypothetical protein